MIHCLGVCSSRDFISFRRLLGHIPRSKTERQSVDVAQIPTYCAIDLLSCSGYDAQKSVLREIIVSLSSMAQQAKHGSCIKHFSQDIHGSVFALQTVVAVLPLQQAAAFMPCLIGGARL